jgi:peroxiredoxin
MTRIDYYKCIMKKLLLALALIAVACGSASATMLGAAAPAFDLKGLDGKDVSLSRFAGTPVVLLHFNTYCHSCIEDIPAINRIAKQFDSVAFIGIATANDEEETRDFQKAYGVEFVLAPDPDKTVYGKYLVHTVPLIDIIDRSGTIRYRGKMPDPDVMHSILKEMLQAKETVGGNLWDRPPDFSLTSIDGTPFRLQDALGRQTIVLTFFSVSDPTTRQVIEVMKTLYQRYTRDDLVLVRIAVDEKSATVEDFLRRHFVRFPVFVDEQGDVARLYGIQDLPRTCIINKRGRIRYVSDQISLANLETVLSKFRSYIREDLPEDFIAPYFAQLEPDVPEFTKVELGRHETIYIGFTPDTGRVIARKVLKDVLCDVCTNVHFVYSFDPTGAIRNIVLIEPIDLYGVPVDAQGFLHRVIESAGRSLPLRLHQDIDGITGATQSCKLLIEGINETPEVLQAIKAYQQILSQSYQKSVPQDSPASR